MRKVKVEMTDLEKVFIMCPADSFSESEDRKCFLEEYTTVSLEELFERGKLTEEEYDSAVEKRRLKAEGII